MAAKTAASASVTGYQFDSLAVKEVIRIVETVLADYRARLTSGDPLSETLALSMCSRMRVGRTQMRSSSKTSFCRSAFGSGIQIATTFAVVEKHNREDQLRHRDMHHDPAS